MKFGDNLKLIRKNKNMSQEVLAEKINVSRQAVSKWENGESYPEMSNILGLCKIFGCQINELVHADMSDISSFDKEIVMKVVKFNEAKQKQVKMLSSIIELIGRIGGILLKVVIPFLIIIMIFLPFIINNVVISGDEIGFKSDKIKIVDNNKLMISGVLVGEFDDDISKNEIIELFSNNSKREIIGCLESGLGFLLISFIVMIIILRYVEKLFNNIKNNKTPFILDNVNYIKRISYLMIALIIIMPLSENLFNLLLESTDSDSSLDLMNILEILIIFSMSYVFEYGYEIQKDSEGKMYDGE